MNENPRILLTKQREKLGLSILDLHRMTGLSRQTLYDLEDPEKTAMPEIETIIKVCNALRLDNLCEWFYTRFENVAQGSLDTNITILNLSVSDRERIAKKLARSIHTMLEELGVWSELTETTRITIEERIQELTRKALQKTKKEGIPDEFLNGDNET